jgi:hypothetical protein
MFSWENPGVAESRLPRMRPLTAIATNAEGFDKILIRAGVWLRLFHQQMGETDYQIIDAMELMDVIDEHLLLLQREALLPLKVLIRIQATLEHIARSLAKCSVEIVTLHGSFNSNNILITTEGTVAAFDTHIRRRGPVYADLAQLLIDLLSRRSAILTYGLFSRPMYWKSAILRGYFEAKSYNPGILNFYCALATIQKWIECEKRIKRWFCGVTVLQPYVARYFLRVLRNFF